MLNKIKRIMAFYTSPFIRTILILGISLVIFLFMMILLSNPFSKYDHEHQIRDICITPSLHDITFEVKKIGNKETWYSKKEYLFRDNNQDFSIIKERNWPDSANVIIEPTSNVGEGFQTSTSISALKDCNPHPLPIFTDSGKGDFLLLGTTANGEDYFSKLLFSFKNTLILSIVALCSFLLFGVLLGVFLGYYKNRFKKIYLVVNYFQKLIESVPIIFWMIISYAFLEKELDYLINYKAEIVFFLFGFFSSTALSKLLVNKFENFRKEDFIVALKLLGVRDRRIIFTHIIKYYCRPIIIMQVVYIIAQCFFIDITLSVLKFKQDGTIGYMFNEFIINSSGWGSLHIIILTSFLYIILSSLFYFAEYLKSISSYE